ncbi:MAG: AAA family ATPase [Planctomycetia bacterium]|nr:AAA family ATPase [Planctomycetia bacterium]
MAPGDLKLLIEAGHPLISIESRDEPRALRIVREVAQALSIPVATWSLTEGIVEKSVEASTRALEARSPSEALRVVQGTGHPTVFAFRDLGVHCREPQVVRQLRDLFFTPASRLWTLVLIDAAGLPPDVRRLTVPFDAGWPDAREMEGVVRETFAAARSRSLQGISARLREALAQAEAMAPVVLWIDEIEKAFASAASATADGGLSQRMFGTLLSWMQDHRHPIFIVATANDIARLPPELMRKGRFDEIFFVDLPDAAGREAVFSIHLRRRRRAPEAFDVGRLAAAAEGLTGAEIEQAVVSGLYAAFDAGTECTTEHVLEAIRTTQPLSVVMREKIEALRDWARDRCVPAD